MPDESQPSDLKIATLKEVEAASKEFAALADSVSGKLRFFIAWLNELQSHVPTDTVWVEYPEAPNGQTQFGIFIARTRDGWGLFCGYGSGSDAFDESWKDVDSASIAEKCMALSLLPVLIEEFRQKQAELLGRLRSANATVTEFPVGTPRKGKEGA